MGGVWEMGDDGELGGDGRDGFAGGRENWLKKLEDFRREAEGNRTRGLGKGRNE